MNILYIDHYAGGPQYGMEFRPYYMAREWVRAGHQVTIVAASYSHLRRRQPVMGAGKFTEEMIDGIRFVWCQTNHYAANGIGRVINIFAFLNRVYSQQPWLADVPDVVIASSTYPLDIFPARKIARRSRALLIWEVHDLWPLSPMELGGMSKWHPFIMLLQHGEDTACREADVVVSMLPKADLHLVERGLDPTKFVYIPNGIDTQEWILDGPALKPSAHAEAIAVLRAKGHSVVGYAGGHAVSNSLDTMLDAAALMRDHPVSWVLVGNGVEKARLVQRVASENLTNVVMLDPVAKSDIPSMLQLFDALYIGYSHQEIYKFGIGANKLNDYLMAGRVVICGASAGNDPVGDAGSGFTIKPDDPVALADAVNKVLQMSPSEREALGRAGRRYVEAHHQYRDLAAKFVGVMRPRVP